MQRLVILFLVACGSSSPKPAPTPAPPSTPAVAAQPAPPPAKQDCADLESCRTACIANDANACERGTEIAFELGKGELEYNQAMTIVALFADAGCKLDNPRTCMVLAALLSDGRGVPKDEARALALYTKACNAGDAESCTSVGFRLAEQKQLDAAWKKYERACELGSGRGCRWLGMELADGNGRAPDKNPSFGYVIFYRL